jgi:hypothetical protein
MHAMAALSSRSSPHAARSHRLGNWTRLGSRRRPKTRTRVPTGTAPSAERRTRVSSCPSATCASAPSRRTRRSTPGWRRTRAASAARSRWRAARTRASCCVIPGRVRRARASCRRPATAARPPRSGAAARPRSVATSHARNCWVRSRHLHRSEGAAVSRHPRALCWGVRVSALAWRFTGCRSLAPT